MKLYPLNCVREATLALSLMCGHWQQQCSQDSFKWRR